MFELPTFTLKQLRFNRAANDANRPMSSLMSRGGRLLIMFMLLVVTGIANARQDVILVLDNSGSMRKNDPEFLATNAVREFISTLEGDIRAGVIIFDQRVQLAVPLTQVDEANKQLLINSLDGINYRGQLTDSPAAVERAIYELKTNAREGAAKYIVFMTDGIVDTGNAAADVEKTKWLREELAVDAADNGIEVLAVAFTENADFFLIQSLAKKTNGDYFRALTAADLSGVFAEIQNRIVNTTVASEQAPVVSEAPPEATPSSAEIQRDPATSDAMSPSEQAEQAAESAVAEDITADDASDLLAQISPEDLEALQEISEIEGIPIEQLARELYGPGDASEQPGVMVSRPGEPAVLIEGDEPPALEQNMLYQLIAAAIGLLILVLMVVWLVRRKGKSSAAEGSDDQAPKSVPAIDAPPAFLHDISGIASEPLTNLDANTLMIGRVAGTPDEHLKYLVINAPTVGRRHALIKYKDKSYWLQDQGSVNGTYVNDKRLSGECQLRHGDRLRFHNAEFEFTQPDIADAGETMIADALPGEETIVADATVMGTIAAAAGVAVASEGSDGTNVAQASAGDSDDMFDAVPGVAEDVALDETLDGSDDSRLDEPGVPADFAGEEITDEAQTSIDDIFDVTGDDIVPAELHDATDGPANDSGGDIDDDDFSEDLTELNPDSSPSEEVDEAFDAEASAFFDDNTVGPVVEGETGPDPTTTNFNADDSGESADEDALFSVDGGDAHDLDQDALDERLERARALAEAADEAPASTDHGGVDHLDTMLNMEAPPQEDPNDVTLDDFIETDTFKAPLTQMPEESNAEPEDVSLEKFVETSAMDANEVSETVIMDEPPTPVEESKVSPDGDGPDAAEIDDDASAFFDDEDNSEDPTDFK